ncbi:MAG: sodium:calcium antiporter [Acidimicrobiales bacterium]
MLVVNLIAVGVSVLVLAYASDYFVSFASQASERLGLPQVFTGVIVVGFGTGLPELFTAIFASLSHHPTLGVASAMGSTAINVTLVVGLAALVSAPAVSVRTLRREGIVGLVGAGFVAAVGILSPSWWFGAVGIALFGAGVAFTLIGSGLDGGGREVESERSEAGSLRPLWQLIGVAGVALACTLGSAELFLIFALKIATSIRLSTGFTGGVLLSFGASLPEIATSVQAARRGFGSVVLGNVIGSSVFNTLMVAPLALLLAPSFRVVGLAATGAATLVLVAVLWLFMRSGKRLSRLEGGLLLFLYLGFLAIVR